MEIALLKAIAWKIRRYMVSENGQRLEGSFQTIKWTLIYDYSKWFMIGG